MSLSKLIHLKYLSLRGTYVYLLPESLSRLKKLETLDIRETNINELPEGIIELKRLRFLYGDQIIIPKEIGRLESLETLARIDAKKSGKQVIIQELGKMTQLQKLIVWELPAEWVDDFCDHSLASMTASLRSLHLRSSRSMGYSLQGLHNLSKPPLLLESLKLYGSLGRIPTWVLSLTNLLKMYLRHSELEEDAIQSLETLPNLVQLTMK